MSNPLRWGILGTGNIARQFAGGMKTAARGRMVAVASRSAKSARAFAASHGIPQAYDRYEDLLRDDAVDAVYISLPNSLHHEWTICALTNGKHVLCEKPLAMNEAEAREMFAAAEKADRILMEAFMYRSHPLMIGVEKEIQRGSIGELRLIRASFCYRTTRIDGNIRFDPPLGGGGLMDVGCYCINFARHFAGAEPASVHAVAHRHPTGVDDIAAGTMLFPNGIVASFTCGMSVQADNTAYLCGSEGFIEIPIPWKPPVRQAVYHVCRATPPRMDQGAAKAPPGRQTIAVDAGKDLYALEADDFAAAVLDGSPARLSAADSLGNMRVLDTIARQLSSGDSTWKSS